MRRMLKVIGRDSKSKRTFEDREWAEAVDRYVAGARRRRWRTGGQGRYVLGSALVLAMVTSPFAAARAGDVLLEGKRNPAHGASNRETQFIASNKTYGTRLSNVKSGDGGGAIYGCRSKAGREPCVRSNNISNGRAFEFSTRGTEGGFIAAKAAGGRPFSTNATGVATGLNADRVDNVDAARIDFHAAAGTPTTDILNFGGLVLRGTCSPGPDITVTATTTVANAAIHISFIRDPQNVPIYRQSNNLLIGGNFDVLGNNDNSAQGTITYATPGGEFVTVNFMSEEAAAFGGTAACLFGGIAFAASPS